SLAANGVDFDTGGPVRPDVAQKAKANLIAEHEAYKKSFDVVKEAAADALTAEMNSVAQSKLQDPEFQQDVEEDKAADAAETGVDFDKFPVVYGPDFKSKYGEYQKLRTAIDRHPDEYGAHKDVVDRMMAELLDVWNKLSQENLFLRAAEAVKAGLRGDGDAYAAERFKMFTDKWREEHVAPAEERFAFLRYGLSAMVDAGTVNTRESTWMDAQMESEFGVVTDWRAGQLANLASAEEKLLRIEELGGHRESADLYTDDAILICEELREYNGLCKNALKLCPPGFRFSDLCPRIFQQDERVMKIFLRGYAVDENGEPESDADLQDKLYDEAFVRAFQSSDKESMEPFLDEIVEELIRTEAGAEMMTDEYIHENAFDLKLFTDKMCYIENLMKMTPWYFDRLSQERSDRLKGLSDVWVRYSTFMILTLSAEGVETNGAILQTGEAMEEAREIVPVARAGFLESVNRRRSERIRKAGGAPDLVYGDADLLLSDDLKEDMRRHDNALRDFSPGETVLKSKGRDARALAIYARGYEKGRDGEPFTEEDRRNKEADGEFIREYLSDDLAVRARRLDLITDELLAMEPTEATSKEMAEDDYILKNAVRLRQCCQKACYLETLRKENPAYFESLPAEKAERLNAIFNAYARYEALMTLVLATHGVRQSNGDLVNDRNEISTSAVLKNAPQADFINTVRMNDAARSFAAARRGA
ncbi:MAG: hypothetical protein LBP73_06210, partial [Clostridiales Family XIII bacterium]|nr:hypothetical protein [Clostridiales Family XIII bacterium]